ncbi:Putative xanthine dehydrogenase YagS FAD-binding subunit [Burkholderia cepacia]|nr:Putative xanthine dehydrogenase YagS FAD-binding subunit [Burkholderia cepacia]
MKAFTYERAKSAADAASIVAQRQGAKFIAGGTNLLDLMKLEIETRLTSLIFRTSGSIISTTHRKADCESARS